MHRNHRISGRARLVIAFIATAAVLGPLAWLWQASLVPGTYSMTDTGTPTTAAAGRAWRWHTTPPPCPPTT